MGPIFLVVPRFDLCYQNLMANSAVQQAVNGFYRSVELLELITRKLD